MEFPGRASATNNDAVFARHLVLPTNSLKILNEEGDCNERPMRHRATHVREADKHMDSDTS